MRVISSVVKDEMFNAIPEELQCGVSFLDHFMNSTTMDVFFTCAYLLNPKLIEIEGYVFVADFFDSRKEKMTEKEMIDKIRRIEESQNYDKKLVEQWVNSRGFGEFFAGATNTMPVQISMMDNMKVLNQFGDILVYFWSRRVKEVFPEKNIVVEYGDNIMGEYGPTITMYQRW